MKRGFWNLLDPSNGPEFFWQVISGPPVLLHIQGLSELANQNNMVKSSSSGNNRKNIFKNPSSLYFKIRTFLIDQSLVDIKLP
jgi:hypothetical protein